MSDGIITTDITFAAELIRRGEAVGVPTETVYGLCCNGLSQSAVERLYELKGRPAIKPMALMVRGAADIENTAKACRVRHMFSQKPFGRDR